MSKIKHSFWGYFKTKAFDLHTMNAEHVPEQFHTRDFQSYETSVLCWGRESANVFYKAATTTRAERELHFPFLAISESDNT